MKPVQTIIAIIALGVLLLPSPLATVARAAEHPGGGQSGKSMVGHMALEVEVTGENICLGCTLKKEKGAQPQCSTYGHQNVLRVERLVAGGRDLSTAKGWLLHYLPTDKSIELIKGRSGETVTVKGKLYINERVLEVASFQAEKSGAGAASEHPM